MDKQNVFFFGVVFLILSVSITLFASRLNYLTGYAEAVASINGECKTYFGDGYGKFKIPLAQCEDYLRKKKEN